MNQKLTDVSKVSQTNKFVSKGYIDKVAFRK